MEFSHLPEENRKNIILVTSRELNLQEQVVEKDWWVTKTLQALFSLPISDLISFKGGTSLSKCWNKIKRMSEDIDVGLDRSLFGMSGNLTKNQIKDTLRRKSCAFVRDELPSLLAERFKTFGLDENQYDIYVNRTSVSTVDPETVYIAYKSLFEPNQYVESEVKIEVSSRSMEGPTATVPIKSFIDKTFKDEEFSSKDFSVNAVLPHRTFLEKIFLLHEEFSRGEDKIRTERMSRHPFDIYMLSQTPIAYQALSNKALYEAIIAHRKTFIMLGGMNYDSLQTETLNIIPPDSVMNKWREDYKTMRETMIYDKAPDFDEIISRLKDINVKVNQIKYKKDVPDPACLMNKSQKLQGKEQETVGYAIEYATEKGMHTGIKWLQDSFNELFQISKDEFSIADVFDTSYKNALFKEIIDKCSLNITVQQLKKLNEIANDLGGQGGGRGV